MAQDLESIEESVFQPLWVIGFYPLVFGAAMAGLGYYVGVESEFVSTGGGVTGGIGLGGVVWFVGYLHVSEWREPAIEAFKADTTNKVRDILGYDESTETFTLRRTYASSLSFVPDRKVDLTTIIIGESSFAVHEEATINLPWFDKTIKKSTREFYFDQIVSVDYDDPDLQIKVSDGELIQYRSSTKPNDVLYTLQDRLRKFKRSS